MKRIVAMIIALVMIGTLVACGSSTPATTTSAPDQTNAGTENTENTENTDTADSKYGGVLKYVIPYSPGSPIGCPWLISGPTSYSSELCIEALLKELSDTTILPNLAKDYEIDNTAGSASITFYLQEGVKFHDGTDFNADAVKWNLENQKLDGGKNKSIAKAWKEIEVIDDYTVKVTVENWTNDMLYGFADTAGFMVSPTAYEENGEEWMETNMVGTGPFIQESYDADVNLVVKRNDNYWKEGLPYLDGIEMLYVTDDMTRKMLFENGDCDILSNGRDTDAAYEMAQAGYTVYNKEGNGNFALWPSSANEDSPWADIRVRQAAEMAIDKEALADAYGHGYLTVISQFTAPSQIGYDSSLDSERSYNLEKAKELMKEAGFENGFDTQMIVSTNVTDKNTVIAIQADLAKIGINCEVEYPTSSAYNEIYAGGTWEGIIYTPINFRANPNVSFKQYLMGDGSYFLSTDLPDNIADLVKASLATEEPDEEAVKAVNKALFDECSIIPITDSAFPWITNDKVQDAGLGKYSTGSFWDYEYVWLSE